MSESAHKPAPSRQELNDLHKRVLRGDPTGPTEVAERFLVPLCRALGRRSPRTPHDSINDAVEDAILDYVGRPQQFDPARLVPLDRFLYIAAWRNVANRMQADHRRLVRETRYAQECSASTLAHTHDEIDASQVKARRDRILSVVTDQFERNALVQWMNGNPAMGPLAAALGLTGCSLSEQRRAIKRFKDRIVKRAVRRFKARASSSPVRRGI